METPLVAIIRGASALDPAALTEMLANLAAGETRVVVIEIESSAQRQPAPLEEFRLCALPTVACVSGELTGYALDLALACDIRVAERTAAFVLAEDRLPALRRLLGASRGASLIAPEPRIEAQTARDLGFVWRVAEKGEEMTDSLAIAAQIGSRGPIATQFAKEAVWRGLDLPLAVALRLETDLTLLLQTTKDRAEGVRAFLEKRPPTFLGD